MTIGKFLLSWRPLLRDRHRPTAAARLDHCTASLKTAAPARDTFPVPSGSLPAFWDDPAPRSSPSRLVSHVRPAACRVCRAAAVFAQHTAPAPCATPDAMRLIVPCERLRLSRPSRPGEFHPEPLTEPDLNLSIHPARATHRRLPSSVDTNRFLRLPVDLSLPPRVTRPLRSTGITPLPRYYEAVRPWLAHRYFGLAGPPLGPFPLASPTRFSSSVRKPRSGSRLLYTGHRMDSK